MTEPTLARALNTKQAESCIARLYGAGPHVAERQKTRMQSVIQLCYDITHSDDQHMFSVPGRIEICGNHTDHNHGKVLAAAVSCDAVCCVTPVPDNTITLFSRGFAEPFVVNLDNLGPVPEEKGTTTALLRGICARFTELGLNTGGFTGVLQSDVLVGSGLSSSAVVEMVIAKTLSVLFNNDALDAVSLAKIGQYAENRYFGKPCGLMDQTACAEGGIISIDFEDFDNPEVRRINADFERFGYQVLVVHTGANHVDLTDDYAAIPEEMAGVAEMFGKKVLRQITLDMVLSKADKIRSELGDRAFIRAVHFFRENQRVDKQVSALNAEDVETFLSLVAESGDSSFKYLQNVFSPSTAREQGIAVALCMTDDFIGEKGEGACRVHGGGFAGTIQVFLRQQHVAAYTEYMEMLLGKGAVQCLGVRDQGAMYLNPMLKE